MKIFGTSRHILLYKETTFELRAVRKLADALAAETAMVNAEAKKPKKMAGFRARPTAVWQSMGTGTATVCQYYYYYSVTVHSTATTASGSE